MLDEKELHTNSSGYGVILPPSLVVCI